MKSHLRGKKKESCVSSTLPILALITSMCALPRSVNILCPHSHMHILGIQVMRLIALLQYWWTMEGFVSPCFIIKAASQGESQGDTREVERMTGKKKMEWTRHWIHRQDWEWCQIVAMTALETKQCSGQCYPLQKNVTYSTEDNDVTNF